MAHARRIDQPHITSEQNQNVSGEAIITLNLDSNEAEAIQHYIRQAMRETRGGVDSAREHCATGQPHPTSLVSSAVRVYDALTPVRRVSG